MLASLVALQKMGNASAGELSNAELAAAERREAVERAAGGDELADLQKQLVQAKVNLAQDMARVDAIGKESGELNKTLDLQDAPLPGVDVSDARLGKIRRELDENLRQWFGWLVRSEIGLCVIGISGFAEVFQACMVSVD
jgi:hypothetical protein